MPEANDQELRRMLAELERYKAALNAARPNVLKMFGALSISGVLSVLKKFESHPRQITNNEAALIQMLASCAALAISVETLESLIQQMRAQNASQN